MVKKPMEEENKEKRKRKNGTEHEETKKKKNKINSREKGKDSEEEKIKNNGIGITFEIGKKGKEAEKNKNKSIETTFEIGESREKGKDGEKNKSIGTVFCPERREKGGKGEKNKNKSIDNIFETGERRERAKEAKRNKNKSIDTTFKTGERRENGEKGERNKKSSNEISFEKGERVEVMNMDTTMVETFYCGVVGKTVVPSSKDKIEVNFDPSTHFPAGFIAEVSPTIARPEPTFLQAAQKYCVGDAVEAREMGCWCRGVIVWIMKWPKDHGVVYFPSDKSMKSYPPYLLRPAMEWYRNQWFLLSRQDETPTVMEIFENSNVINKITVGLGIGSSSSEEDNAGVGEDDEDEECQDRTTDVPLLLQDPDLIDRPAPVVAERTEDKLWDAEYQTAIGLAKKMDMKSCRKEENLDGKKHGEASPCACK